MTLPPRVLSEVCQTIHIDIPSSYVVNLGINRPNISWEVRYMNAAKSDLESLRILLPRSNGGEAGETSFNQTMVFGNDINQLMRMCQWVHSNTSPGLHNHVAVYHSWLTSRTKQILLHHFRMAEIKVLFTTEAAGMVSLPLRQHLNTTYTYLGM